MDQIECIVARQTCHIDIFGEDKYQQNTYGKHRHL